MPRRRILIIEDDPALATMYQLALSSAGFDAQVAGDGLTALEEIDEAHPDLVVLDLQLPQIDGDTILREVAATPDTRHIPVIIVTGSDIARGDDSPVVLRKPFETDQLIAAVERQFHKAAA